MGKGKGNIGQFVLMYDTVTVTADISSETSDINIVIVTHVSDYSGFTLAIHQNTQFYH